jgi:hypothetical protein
LHRCTRLERAMWIALRLAPVVEGKSDRHWRPEERDGLPSGQPHDAVR